MADYTKHLVYANGILVFNNQDVTASWPNVNTPVQTIPGGEVGPSPGPQVCNVSIKNAKPKAGSDFNWQKAQRSCEPIELKVIQIGGKTMVGKFIVNSYETGSSVGGEPTESVEMSSIGTPAPIFE